jgi:hypothetical protein
MSARRKGPAFDPARLDDIDDVLGTPVQAAPNPTELAPPARSADSTMTAPTTLPPIPSQPPAPRAAPISAPAPAPEAAPPRRTAPVAAPSTPAQPAREAKGQGGRPPTRRAAERAVANQLTSGPIPVAVRIPPQLYSDVNNDLLSGPERPSYGQLVIWTLEDHPADVAGGILATRDAAGRKRRPRGHRLAAPDVQITLRLNLAERDFLDEFGRSIEPDDGKPVTRTEIAIASLQIALHRAD